MSLYQDMEIDALIEGCRSHDDDAFDELVRRYTPMMRKVVASFGTQCDFDELFSEACVALHNAAQRYNAKQSDVTFGLYARICVRNRILDLLRSESKVQSITDNVDAEPSDEASLEKGLLNREMFDNILGSAKDLLSDYEYSVLILHIQGYKTAAIAKMLSRPAKSVDNAKNRIFRRLRAEFGDIS